MLGAVSAASGLLEAAISIIKRIRTAYERQKELVKILESYHDELITIESVLRIVRDEEALQTAAVASQLAIIEGLARTLRDCLQTLDPGAKGPLHQFAHQLVQGSKDEKALTVIMNKLARARSELGLHIQVANVGLTRIFGDKLVANTEVVRRVNFVLQQVFGEGRGLKIAMLLKNRPAQGAFGHTPLVKASDKQQMMAWCL